MEQPHHPPEPWWEEIPDAIEKPSPLLSAIEQMRPEEVLALWHGIDLHGSTLEERPTPTPEATDFWHHEIDVNLELLSQLDYALWQLPQRSIEHARNVYAAFADSPLDDDRGHIAIVVNAMTRYDQEFGLALWDRLMRDPSERVRQWAYRNLADYIDHEEEVAEQRLAVLGITWHDTSRLQLAYRQAQAGFGTHALARAALRRALNPEN